MDREPHVLESHLAEKNSLPDLLFDAKSTDDCLQKDETGSVYRGYWRGNTAVIKFYTDFTEEKFLNLNSTMSALEPISKKTQNIVKIFAVLHEHSCVITEYVTKNSTLENYLTTLSAWPLDLRLRIALDITHGLQALHEHKIAHPNLISKCILLKILPNKPLTAKLLIRPEKETLVQHEEQKESSEENLFSTNIQALGEILHKIFLSLTSDIPPTIDILISQSYEPDPKNRPSLDEFQRALAILLKSQPYSEEAKEIEAKLWKRHAMAENNWQYPRYVHNKIYSLTKDFDLDIETLPNIPQILDIDIIKKLRRDIEFYRDSKKFDHSRQNISDHDLLIHHTTEVEMSEYKSTIHSFSIHAKFLASKCHEHLILLEKAKHMIEEQSRLDKRKNPFFSKPKAPERETFSLFGLLPGLSYLKERHEKMEAQLLPAHQEQVELEIERLEQENIKLKVEAQTLELERKNFLLKSKLEELEFSLSKSKAPESETFPLFDSSVPKLSGIQVQLYQKKEAQEPLTLFKKEELEVEKKKELFLSKMKLELIEKEKMDLERESFLLESKLETQRLERDLSLLKSKVAKKEIPQLLDVKELEILSRLDDPLRYQVLVLRDGLKLLEKEVNLPTLNLEDEKTYKKIIKIICDKFNISEWVLNRTVGFYLKPDQFQEFKKQVKLDKRRQNFFKLREDYIKIAQSIDNLFHPYDDKNKDQDYIGLNTLLLRQLFATLNYLIEMAIAKYPDWLGGNKKLINELVDKYKTNITASGLDKHFTLVKSMLNKGETYSVDNYKKMTETLSQEFTLEEFEIYQGFLSLIAENMHYLQDCKEITQNSFFIELGRFIADLDSHFNEISEMNDTVLETFSNYKNNFSRLEIRKSSDEIIMQDIYSDQLYLINCKLEQKLKPEERNQLVQTREEIIKKQQKHQDKQRNLKKQMGEVSYEMLMNKNKLVLQARHLEQNLLKLQQELNELAYKINLFLKNHEAKLQSFNLFEEINEALKIIIEDVLSKISTNGIRLEKIDVITKRIKTIVSDFIVGINELIAKNHNPKVPQGLKSSMFVQKESKYETQRKEIEEAIIKKVISIKSYLQTFMINPMISCIG